MDISVVLCTYNRSKSLIKTLESINQLRVTREIKWEFILVDNNSTDNTKQIVLDFINKSQHEVIYCFEKSQGLSYARNAGIKLAKGSIVAFTDDDVLIENNWLTNMFDAFNSHEEPWCVGGKILPIWGAVRPAWLADNMLGVLALLDRGDNKIILKLPDIWGANMAFKAQTFKEYGDFDTSLGRTKGKLYAGEETAIIEALIRNNKVVLYDPGLIVHHAIDSERLTKRYFRKWHFDQGELSGYTRPFKGKYFLVPLSPVKELFKDIMKWLSLKNADHSVRFKLELKAYNKLGVIWGSVKKSRYIGVVKS